MPRSAGMSTHATEVLARTAGHSLSVVEYLRALAAGDTGVPESLAAAIQTRVDRLPPAGRELVQGASVLRGRLDPRLLGDLVGIEELAAVRLCEELAVVGLLHRVGGALRVRQRPDPAVRLPLAGRRRWLRRTTDGPPTCSATNRSRWRAQPTRRASPAVRRRAGCSRAGRDGAFGGRGRDRTLRTGARAGGGAVLRARVLLAPCPCPEASTAYATALEDIDEALTLAGADVTDVSRWPRFVHGAETYPWRCGCRPPSGCAPRGGPAARLPSLGDRAAEADFSARLAVLEASRLRLASALARAEAGLARARASSSEEAIPFALDGVKNVLGYLGEGDRLREVVAELVPGLRERGSAWLLQWAVLESSYAAAAEDAWDEAQALVEEALEVNRNTGFRAYTGYFRAHLGWYERLAGDLDTAIARGRTAVAETSPVDHPWWYAAAAGLLSSTLLEAGRSAEAESLARRGLAVAGPEAPEAWRLRCLAPLAVNAGPAGDKAFVEARRLLAAIECPPGKAWVLGGGLLSPGRPRGGAA